MQVTGGDTDVAAYFMVRLAADGTAATGLTVTNFDLQYTRTLTAAAAKADGIVGTGGAATHVDNKVFEVNATSSPGLYMACFVDAAFAVGVPQVMLALTNPTDSAFAETVACDIDAPVNITRISADSTAATNLELDYDGTGYAKTNSTIGTATTLNGHTAQTGDNYARLGAPAGASVSADIAAVEAQTDDIGAAGAGLTAMPWNSAWDVEIQSECADALVAYDPPTKAELDTAQASVTLAAATHTGAVIPTVTTLTGHTVQTGDNFAEIGTAGAGLTDLGGMSTAMKAEAQTEANDALVANGLDHLVSAAVVGADVTDNSIIAKLAAKGATADWDTFDNTTDSHEALVDNVATLAQLNTEVDTALSDVRLDELMTKALASQPTAGSVMADLTEDDGGTQRFTTNALEQAPTGGSAPTAAAIVDEWETQSQADPTGFHVNVKEWTGTAVTVSATTALPEVDAKSISDNAAAADNVQANIGNLDATVSSRMAEASISTTGGAVDTVTTNTDMRGTDSAALASVCTETRLAELDPGNLPTDVANVKIDTAATLLDTGTDGVQLAASQTQGWASALESSAGQILERTVDTATNTHVPTTTEFQADDETEATADHYKGRVVIFTSGVLSGQATDITAYVAVGGIGQFTVTAMTEAPANDDTFVMV